MLAGVGIWWSKNGEDVEFFDGVDEPCTRQEGPELHHFRSSDLIISESKQQWTALNFCNDKFGQWKSGILYKQLYIFMYQVPEIAVLEDKAGQGFHSSSADV